MAGFNEITLITSLPLPPPGAVRSPLPCTAPSQRADATSAPITDPAAMRWKSEVPNLALPSPLAPSTPPARRRG